MIMELVGMIIGFTFVVVTGVIYYNFIEYQYHKANGGKLTFKEFLQKNLDI